MYRTRWALRKPDEHCIMQRYEIFAIAKRNGQGIDGKGLETQFRIENLSKKQTFFASEIWGVNKVQMEQLTASGLFWGRL
jgi:hypothetical protein